MSASIKFLTGRKCHVDGFTFRDDAGVERDVEFLVVGPSPARSVPGLGDGMVQVQDVIDSDISHVGVEFIRPI